MLAELRVIFPLEISLYFRSQCTGRDQAGSGRVFIQVHYGLGKPTQALPPKSLTLSFPSITHGPFAAVPGSQDTDVLSHFVLFSRVSYPI